MQEKNIVYGCQDWSQTIWSLFLQEIWQPLPKDKQEELLERFPQPDTVENIMWTGRCGGENRPTMGLTIAASMAGSNDYHLPQLIDFPWLNDRVIDFAFSKQEQFHILTREQDKWGCRNSAPVSTGLLAGNNFISETEKADLESSLAISLSLNVSKKYKVLRAFPTLSPFQVKELQNVFKEERTKWSMFDPASQYGIKTIFERIKPEWEKIKQSYHRDMLEQGLKVWFANLSQWQPPAYLVGGAVRDILLNRPAKDLDLTHPEAESLALALRDHHQATLVELFSNDEIKNTWRLVQKDDNEQQELDLSTFHGSSVEDDLAHRDFTINAMAYTIDQDGSIGELLDPFQGRDDLLVYKEIRQISATVFQDDPLRILRAYRFSATLGLTIAAETRKSLRQHRALLPEAARERQLQELMMIFSSKRAFATICQMDEDGVLEQIFPEIAKMKGCEQNSFHHKDVWQHCLLVLQHCEDILANLADFFGKDSPTINQYLAEENRLPLLKLTALLHDVAKPACKDTRQDGRITFYSHDQQGAEMITAIGERLLIGKKGRQFLQKLVANHIQVLSLAAPEVKQSTINKWLRKMNDDCLAQFILALADTKATQGPDADPAQHEQLALWIKETAAAYLGHYRQEFARKELLTGKDLIAAGVKPGPEIGRILRLIKDKQDEGSIQTREQALALLPELKKQSQQTTP